MSELREAAQELLDYFDSIRPKYGSLTIFQEVGERVDKVRKALDNPTEDDVENILDNIVEVNKMLNGEQQVKKTVLYLQVLLPQLKEQGDVTSVGWIEGALDEGEQPHTSPEAEERLAKIKELVEASNEEKTDDV